ncbi:sodium-dependent phosphate transport protein 1 [Ctenodactylus gundi]
MLVSPSSLSCLLSALLGTVSNFCSFRFGVSVLLHFCNVAMVAQRACLNLTMVTMVNQTDPHGLRNASTREEVDNITNPTYHWSPDVQGIILSSIFYGTVVVQVPAGYFSGIYPIKPLLGFGLFLSSVLSLCIPPIAEVGATALILCRVVQGMAQGVVGTVQHHIWVKWAPPLERGLLISVSISGIFLGSFMVLLATGFICEHLGWPMVFYILGAYGCATSLFWFILFYNEPKDHPCISISEKDYVTSSLTQQNGLLSSLSPLTAYIIGILSGQLGDFFLSRKILSTLAIRKLFTVLGTLCPVVFSLCLLYLRFNLHSTIVFLTLASSTSSFAIVGVIMNPLDIAPRYYGFIKGVTALIGTIGVLISSTVTGMMLSQNAESSWYKILFLMSAVNVVSTIFYLTFAGADVQDWAKATQDTRL